MPKGAIESVERRDEALEVSPASPPALPVDRKESSRERLLSAGAVAFCARGYFPVSVEDIASAASVSRMTFYRHFTGKAELAAELFRRSSAMAEPHYLAIAQTDYRDREVVRGWMESLFSADRQRRHLLRVFIQANVDAPAFSEAGHGFIDGLAAKLGEHIPAFAHGGTDGAGRRRHVEAWLLLYDILNHSNHAALGSGIATDPLTIDILADRFSDFVERHS